MSTLDGTRARPTLTSTRRGFSTSKLRLRVADEQTPAVVSARGYLRTSVPEIYKDGEFGIRFLGALETLLDPIVGTLDVLHRYFHPDTAPRDILDLVAAWLGLTVDESWPEDRCRAAVRLAGELGRRRGTRKGLELTLGIVFPDLPLRVEGGGTVVWSPQPGAPPPEVASADFVVFCDAAISESEQAAVARVIELAKPVHAAYKLRVRAPRKRPEGEAP